MTITTTWDETAPAATANISEGDDRIRELKTQVREVLAMDHVMSATASSTDTPSDGYHNKVTFCEQGSSPSMVANTIMMFSKETNSKSELFCDAYDWTNSEIQLTEDGNWIAGIKYEVRMFSGLTANIPTGWVICDGNNSTPNLTDKFVRSTVDTITTRAWTGEGAFGAGGSDSVTLAEENMPAHTHTCGSESAHTHSGTTGSSQDEVPTSGSGGIKGATYVASPNATYANDVYTQGHTHTFSTGGGSAHSHTIGSKGSGTAFDNMPAYVELAFIMKS